MRSGPPIPPYRRSAWSGSAYTYIRVMNAHAVKPPARLFHSRARGRSWPLALHPSTVGESGGPGRQYPPARDPIPLPEPAGRPPVERGANRRPSSRGRIGPGPRRPVAKLPEKDLRRGSLRTRRCPPPRRGRRVRRADEGAESGAGNILLSRDDPRYARACAPKIRPRDQVEFMILGFQANNRPGIFYYPPGINSGNRRRVICDYHTRRYDPLPVPS
jgi:hypothetical protein